MPLLAVSAHDIDTAGLAVEADLPPAWLAAELTDAALTAGAPGHLSARLSRSSDDIIVRGRVKAALTTPCARCLDPAEVPIDTELSLLLRPAPAEHAGHHAPSKNGKSKRPSEPAHTEEDEYEFTAEEADIDTYDGETVVLDGFVREAILLEVPKFPLCSEGCPGIRPAAVEAPEDTGPRIDPRLAPLGALSDKLRDKLKAGPEAAPAPAEAPAKSRKTKKE